jgi:hypothetical protein
MATISILATPAERDRLKAFDAELLVTKQVMVGNTVVREEFTINAERELARFQEIAEGLDEVTADDPDEIADKGIAPEIVAELVYGSRIGFYAGRVRGAFSYDGPVSMSLGNGHILDVTGDGLIIKTAALEHFESAVNRATGKCIDLASRGVSRNVGRFNNTTAMLARRNPAVAALVEENRRHADTELPRRIGTSLKALAPAPAPKKKP